MTAATVTPLPTVEATEPWPLLRQVVGHSLRRARLGRRRTLRDVAHHSRVSLAYLSEIERGRKEPSSEILSAVCEALGYTMLDLTADVARTFAAYESRAASLGSAAPSGVLALAA